MTATSPVSEAFADARRYGSVLILAGIVGVLALVYPGVSCWRWR
jgi:hypothetical protein